VLAPRIAAKAASYLATREAGISRAELARRLGGDSKEVQRLLGLKAEVLSLCRLLCEEAHMATNLAIDPELLERAVEVSGERTKKAVVTKALQEFIARREQKRLVELMGKLEWDDSFNYKAERSRS